MPLTPYRADRWWWHLLFWLPIALFIAYFALVAAASVILAITMRARAFRSRAREGSAPTLITDKISPAIVSALSGQGVSLSPSLLRFATPGCWDILHHTQFIVGIAMLAVRWPDFAYPFLRQVGRDEHPGPAIALILHALHEPQLLELAHMTTDR